MEQLVKRSQSEREDQFSWKFIDRVDSVYGKFNNTKSKSFMVL